MLDLYWAHASVGGFLTALILFTLSLGRACMVCPLLLGKKTSSELCLLRILGVSFSFNVDIVWCHIMMSNSPCIWTAIHDEPIIIISSHLIHRMVDEDLTCNFITHLKQKKGKRTECNEIIQSHTMRIWRPQGDIFFSLYLSPHFLSPHFLSLA